MLRRMTKGDVSRLWYVVVVGLMGKGDIRFKGDRGRRLFSLVLALSHRQSRKAKLGASGVRPAN